jgi:hypothetical protein
MPQVLDSSKSKNTGSIDAWNVNTMSMGSTHSPATVHLDFTDAGSVHTRTVMLGKRMLGKLVTLISSWRGSGNTTTHTLMGSTHSPATVHFDFTGAGSVDISTTDRAAFRSAQLIRGPVKTIKRRVDAQSVSAAPMGSNNAQSVCQDTDDKD